MYLQQSIRNNWRESVVNPLNWIEYCAATNSDNYEDDDET